MCDLVNNFVIILLRKILSNQLSFVPLNRSTKNQVSILCKAEVPQSQPTTKEYQEQLLGVAIGGEEGA